MISRILVQLSFFFLCLMQVGFGQACPLCKLSLINSPEGRQIAAAFNDGILFLLAMPYILVGLLVLGIFFLKRSPNIKNRFKKVVKKTALVIGFLFFATYQAQSHSGPHESPPGSLQTLPKKNLAVYGDVGSFKLVDQNGKSFQDTNLKGKIWIANFIFTRCTDECPLLTQRMKALQRKLDSLPNLAFVSFSVDPKYDTPSVLSKYAVRFRTPGNWHFLTGNPQVLQSIIEKKFHLPVSTKGGPNRLTHSNMFVLVDGKGKIRGYYDSTQPEALDLLLKETKMLAANKS